jgi:regulator of sigma D
MDKISFTLKKDTFSGNEEYIIYIKIITDVIKSTDQELVDKAAADFIKIRDKLINKKIRFSMIVDMLNVRKVSPKLVINNTGLLKGLDRETHTFVKSCGILCNSQTIRDLIKATHKIVQNKTRYDVFEKEDEAWKYLRLNYTTF